MRIHIALSTAIVCGSVLLAAQSQPPPKDSAKDPDAKPITLSGCVSRSSVSPGQFSLADDGGQPVYHLIGSDVRKYFGQRVEVIGGVPPPKKLVIAGGLRPSANVAAQAGDIDPTHAAMATAGGSAGPGTFQLPDFRVKSVRPVSGSCP